MRIQVVLILTVLIASALSLNLADLEQDLRQNYESELTSSNLNVRKLVKLYEALEFAGKTLDKKQLCDVLLKIPIKSISEDYDLLALYQSGCFTQVEDETRKLINKYENSDKLQQYYLSFMLGTQFELVKNIGSACKKVAEFLDASGSGKIQLRKQEMSYELSSKVFEMGSVCLQLNATNQQFKERFTQGIKNLIQNSNLINQFQRGIFDGNDFICTTCSNVYFMNKVNQFLEVEEFNKVLGQFVEFVSSNFNENNGLCQQYNTLRLFRSLQNYPIVVLANGASVLANKKGQSIQVKIVNPFGQTIQSLPDVSIKGRVLQGDKVFVDNVKFTQNKDHTFQASIDATVLKNAGQYNLQVQTNTKEFRAQRVLLLRVNAQVTIKGLDIDITQSKKGIQHYKYKNIEYGKLFNQQLEANQNNFIHLKFKLQTLDDVKFVPRFVAVRLEFPQYKYSTNYVVATLWDKTDNIYKAVVDLGNPDHVLAYSGQYRLVISVSDQFLANNLNWHAANIDVSFRKTLTSRPEQDTDYVVLKEIHHHFPAPPKQPNFLLVQLFNGAIVFLAIAFVGIVFYQGSNLNEIPSSFFGFLSNIAFIALLFLNIIVLVLFWVYLNLFQTLALYAILLIPTLVIGNAALNSKNEDNQNKLKQE